MVSTGHYLATMAAARVLEQGGNAIDAGVAAGLCINVAQPDMTNLGGVAPIILYSAEQNTVRTISGLGTWPKNVKREYFIDQCGGQIPPGVRRCVMPAAIDSWLTALKHYGTFSFADVAAPAIELAEEGFAAYHYFRANIEVEATTLASWPSTAEIYLPGGCVPEIGEKIRQKDLGNTLRMLVDAEGSAHSLGREGAIQSARDRFYRGDIAERIAQFFDEQGGFLTLEDLESFSVDIEEPVSVTYRDYEVYGCRTWCQGPVALQALAILDGYDLASMDEVDSLHLVVEALKAAYADREHYYGDPKFMDVPINGLLDPDYAASWRGRISQQEAFPGMPEPGDPWEFEHAGQHPPEREYVAPISFQAQVEPDTSYLSIVDEWGNAISATPSDGVSGSPVIPGLGFSVSSRGKQARLELGHPSTIEPGKRPRLTPNPGLIMREGKVVSPYGCPGNDAQPQAMVQFVVNLIDRGMNPQAAIEAPRLTTFSFPRSDHPHPYTPGLLKIEPRFAPEILMELERRGHQLERWSEWEPLAGSVCAVVVNSDHSVLLGAADPRTQTHAIGW